METHRFKIGAERQEYGSRGEIRWHYLVVRPQWPDHIVRSEGTWPSRAAAIRAAKKYYGISNEAMDKL